MKVMQTVGSCIDWTAAFRTDSAIASNCIQSFKIRFGALIANRLVTIGGGTKTEEEGG